MHGSGCKGSSRIPTNTSHSRRCWHLRPLRAAREERGMRYRTGTTEITLTAALVKLALPALLFSPAGNSGAEQRAQCHRGNSGEAANRLQGWGCQPSLWQRGLGVAAEGPRGAICRTPLVPRDAAGSHLPATGIPRRPPGPAAEALCQPCTRVPIALIHTRAPLGHCAQPCLAPRECPATLRVPRSPCSPNIPVPPGCVCRCRPSGSPGRCGGRTRPARSALSRLASPAPSRPRSAPPCPVPARHSNARQRPGERPAARHRSDRTAPDRTGPDGAGRGQRDSMETPDLVSCGGAGGGGRGWFGVPVPGGCGDLVLVPQGSPVPVAVAGAGRAPIPVPGMGHCRAEMPQGDRQRP